MTKGIRRYGPGKYSTVIDAYVHELTLDGCDAEAGDVQTIGWYGLIRGFGEDDQRTLQANGFTDEERELIRRSAGAIVSEDDRGFVSVEYFDTAAELDRAWEDIEQAEADAYEDEDGEL